MAVVCFRIAPHVPGTTPPRDEEINSLNRRLVEAVNRTGKAYLTYTTLNGQVAMRLAVGNILTTERHLAVAFNLIRREAAQLHAAS
jgi:aromatic-L-amino-acid decarboxylase